MSAFDYGKRQLPLSGGDTSCGYKFPQSAIGLHGSLKAPEAVEHLLDR